jgi:ferric-dicitrate binding protein FerR (iron transport regulator)
LNCERVEEVFADYLDGAEVPPDVATSFEAHLGECAACRERLARLAGQHRDILYLSAARALPPASTPPVARGPTRTGVVGLALGLTATAAAVAFGVLLSGEGTHTPVRSAPPDRAVAPPPRAAQLVAVGGRVLRAPPDSPAVAVSTPGEWLAAGDMLAVDLGGRAAIRFLDGARADLGPRSVLQVHDPAGEARCFLAVGRARFAVPPQRTAWRMYTPDADIDVLGTVFDVEVMRTGAPRR